MNANSDECTAPMIDRGYVLCWRCGNVAEGSVPRTHPLCFGCSEVESSCRQDAAIDANEAFFSEE